MSVACFVVLPGAWPQDLLGGQPGGEPSAGDGGATFAFDGRVEQVERCAFLPPRAASALKLDGSAASPAEAAASGADRFVIVPPIGRYDDGVWTPIVERLLRRRLAGAPNRPAAYVAWAGLEPFFAAFGGAGPAWDDPRLASAVLKPLEAAAGSLAAVLRAVASEHGPDAVQRGVVRFASASEGGVRLSFA